VEARLQADLEVYFAEVDLEVSKKAWAFDVLIETLGDPDVFVRLAAAQALSEINDPRARRALEHASERDTEAAVRDAAAAAALNCK
jgi:HEAT repeat protein